MATWTDYWTARGVAVPPFDAAEAASLGLDNDGADRFGRDIRVDRDARHDPPGGAFSTARAQAEAGVVESDPSLIANSGAETGGRMTARERTAAGALTQDAQLTAAEAVVRDDRRADGSAEAADDAAAQVRADARAEAADVAAADAAEADRPQ